MPSTFEGQYPTDGYTTVSTVTYSTGSGYTSTTVTPPSGFWWRKTTSKSSTNTPKFKKLRASGARLPDNNFSFESRQVLGGSASAVRTRSYNVSWPFYSEQNVYTTQSPGWGGAVDDPEWGNPDWSKVKFRLLQKARGQQFNLPVFLGEFSQTSSMVVNTAAKMVHSLRALRKGHLGDFVNLLHPKSGFHPPSGRELDAWGKDFRRNPGKAAANAWLEYKYGWIPFMSDVRDAVMTLMEISDRPASLETRVATRLRSDWGDIRNTKTTHFGGQLSVAQRTESSWSKSGVWKLSLKPESIPGKLGLTNPVLVAWELVPLSFVADWFSPLGDYFAQFDNEARFAHSGGTLGWRYERKTDNSLFAQKGDGMDTAFGWCQYNILSVNRLKMTSAPYVSFNELSVSNPFGFSIGDNVKTSVALLRQKLRSLDKR
ncbi:MAG: maturation protein [Sanya fiers-like virus 41]|nr:MAG: maturation protein [Sanya fiers-like virus 41]